MAARLQQSVHRNLSGVRRQRGPYRLSWGAERAFLRDRLPGPIRLDNSECAGGCLEATP